MYAFFMVRTLLARCKTERMTFWLIVVLYAIETALTEIETALSEIKTTAPESEFLFYELENKYQPNGGQIFRPVII